MSLQPIPSFSERNLKDGCPASSLHICQSENNQVNGELTWMSITLRNNVYWQRYLPFLSLTLCFGPCDWTATSSPAIILQVQARPSDRFGKDCKSHAHGSRANATPARCLGHTTRMARASAEAKSSAGAASRPRVGEPSLPCSPWWLRPPESTDLASPPGWKTLHPREEERAPDAGARPAVASSIC